MYNNEWWLSSPLMVGWGLLIIVFALWSIVWKGMALWKSARLGHKGWFIALLIINTAGILEILYIYVFSKPKLPPHHHDQTPMVPPTEPTV